MRNYVAIFVLFLSTLCLGEVRPESVIGKVHNPRTPFTSERLGTAWCLTPKCELMITNYHVVQFIGQKLAINGERVAVSWSATGPDDQGARFVPSFTESYKYTLVRDLAILKMKEPMSRKGMHGVRLYSGQLQAGETVTVLSYPAGKLAVTSGNFDSIVEDGILKFNMAAPLAAGCSGGLILNDRDEAVGVLFALHPSRTSVYAVPIWSLAQFVKKVQPDLYSSLFPVDPYRPDITGRVLTKALATNPEPNPAPIPTPNPTNSLVAAAKGGINPIAILPAALLRSAFTDTPVRPQRSMELHVRDKETIEVQTLRRKAQMMVEQMANFVALQTLTLSDNAVWQHQVRVVDGQQTFTRADGTELKELPLPHLGIVPGSEWRDLPQMVGSNLRLPLRYLGERTENRQTVKVFEYTATQEDRVCWIRVKRGWLMRVWKGAVPCRGEVWTDSDFNILRITQEMTLPRESTLERTKIIVLYGWLRHESLTERLVPVAIQLRAEGAHGWALESSATFSAYRVFHASAMVLPN